MRLCPAPDVTGTSSGRLTVFGCTGDAFRAAGVAVFWLALIPGAMAAQFTFQGTWECDVAPKIGVSMVSVPSSAVRDGDRLTVSRAVHRAGTFEVIGHSSGTATIRDGRVAVEMATEKRGITGRFEGTVSDTEIVLSGVEHVIILDRGEDDRACRVRLKRLQ
jgi:hypothetical protein